jgi:hypothetical protein
MPFSEDRLLELMICLLLLKDDIPCPTSDMLAANIYNLGSPFELIAVFICSFRLFVIKIEYGDAEFRECMQFDSLR